jgi:hypothetical protein
MVVVVVVVVTMDTATTTMIITRLRVGAIDWGVEGSGPCRGRGSKVTVVMAAAELSGEGGVMTMVTTNLCLRIYSNKGQDRSRTHEIFLLLSSLSLSLFLSISLPLLHHMKGSNTLCTVG